MEAEGRTNRHPEVSSERSRNHYRMPDPITENSKADVGFRPRTGLGGNNVRLSETIKQQGGMRHDGGRRESEPSSLGEDERSRNHYRNACPIHQKKEKIIARIETDD